MGDFYYILETYMEIAGETLFEAAYEDLIDEDFKPQIAAAKILARQMLPILQESTEVKQRVFTIIKKLKEKFSDSEIDEMYRFEPNEPKIRRFKLVSCVAEELNKGV